MNNTEEIKLAQEFQMYDLVDKLKNQQAYLDQITAMNFKIISEKDIRKKLKIRFKTDHLTYIFELPLIGIIISSPLLVHALTTKAWLPTILSVCFWLFLGICLCIEYGRENLGVKDIRDWRHKLPEGAYYAMREAKAKLPIRSFSIYYPVTKSDPIICAKAYTGDLIEIFSWNDGKTYS